MQISKHFRIYFTQRNVVHTSQSSGKHFRSYSAYSCNNMKGWTTGRSPAQPIHRRTNTSAISTTVLLSKKISRKWLAMFGMKSSLFCSLKKTCVKPLLLFFLTDPWLAFSFLKSSLQLHLVIAAEMQEANVFSSRLESMLPAAPMATICVRGARWPHSSCNEMSTRLPTTCSTARRCGASVV